MHTTVLKTAQQTTSSTSRLLRSAVALAILCTPFTLQAQRYAYTGQVDNYISTGMPIILVSPDATAGAMADIGAASLPDANSAHWNNAKFAFIKDEMGLTTTYTPWLRHLQVNDMNLLYIAGYKRINNRSTVAASLTYFSLGNITSTNEEGANQGTFKPNEFAFDVSYAMKLSDNFSLGATGRFLHSDLTNGMDINSTSTKAANGLAADVGVYYQQEIDHNQSVAAGAHLSNVGSKLSYSDDDSHKEFLPTNLRIGGRYTYTIDNYNEINAMVDINKLLVPTPPVSDGDTTYSNYYPTWSAYEQTSSIQGLFRSFYDAPGGLKEELQEIQLSIGAEYWYAKIFAVRAGYFFEHKHKGGRQYLTIGGGVRYNMFHFDLAYLIPTTNFSQSPLANTIRISISVNMAKEKK
ncbi:MAG: type IX secretion system outer membrane channel protein PorV [Bacteroidales bacterium]|nr:type IX secretion system outer membrane channel protein PorV [Bacteroidales bacterium]